MLNKELEFTLDSALKSAEEKRHEFMTVDHLLLALLDNSDAIDVLNACCVNIESLRLKLSKHIDETTPVLFSKLDDRDTQPTLGIQRVVQRAIFQAQSAGLTEMGGANMLAAIFSEKDCHGVILLKQNNVSRLDVTNYLSQQIPLPDEKPDPQFGELPPESDAEPTGDDLLEKYATNLNRLAINGEIDPVIGREEETERAIQTLCRRRKNNPLYVGEAGVGKTALAGNLAQRIVAGEVPSHLLDKTLYELDLGALLAGTKYRGDFEKRFKKVLNQLKLECGAILFIDEIHTIIGAGSTNSGAIDVSNLLKPMLASGELACVGSTTQQEYRTIFEKDKALVRRFQKIDVCEPSVEDTVEILKGLQSRFADHHGVDYTEEALVAAAKLSSRFITDRQLPDKAIDVIDEAGAYLHLCETDNPKTLIDVEDIERVIAKIARIPERTVSSSDRESLRLIERNLKMLVYGQDEAIESLTAAVKLSRSGLREDHKPVGSFLFSGPTGVGKTEVTKQLATCLGVQLIRFDMSEYMEQHTVSRLIGAPPGYVGFDQGGLLTEAVTKSPYAVVLLDEIEKAHPDINNLLLQIMDNGTLTDTNGRVADFRHTILIMTTNAGAQTFSASSIGFSEQDNTTDALKVIKRAFSPEFRNRLDAIIQFKPLNNDTIHHVVDKFILELEHQLQEKGVTLEISPEAVQWLSTNGYDEQMGARPMARLIQEHIKKPLAEELLFGQLAYGGHIEIIIVDNKIQFEFREESISA